MSTEPAGTNGNFKKVKRTSLKLTKKDWCSYVGECNEKLDVNNDLCLYCKYRKLLDIPKMLNERKKYE